MIRKTLIVSLVLFGTLAMVSAESLIQNGNFSKPIKPWKVISLKDTPATENSVVDGVLTIKATGASEKPGSRQLSQEANVKTGETYTLTFDVMGKLEQGTELVVAVVPAPGKFAFFKKVPITTEWTTQIIKVTPKEMELAEGASPMIKFLIGSVKGEVSFRKVSLEPGAAKTAEKTAPAATE